MSIIAEITAVTFGTEEIVVWLPADSDSDEVSSEMTRLANRGYHSIVAGEPVIVVGEHNAASMLPITAKRRHDACGSP